MCSDEILCHTVYPHVHAFIDFDSLLAFAGGDEKRPYKIMPLMARKTPAAVRKKNGSPK
jgi:hypothetical protein